MKWRNHVVSFLSVLVAGMASAWLGQVVVDLGFDPPLVLQELPLVSDSACHEDGSVSFRLAEGFNGTLWFDFIAEDGTLLDGDSLAYLVCDAEGTLQDAGFGTEVPVGLSEGASVLSFYSLDGGVFEPAKVSVSRTEGSNTGRVSVTDLFSTGDAPLESGRVAGEVDAESGSVPSLAGGARAANQTREPFVSINGGTVTIYRPTTATAYLSVFNEDEGVVFAGMSSSNPSRQVATLGEILGSGSYPGHTHAFGVSVSGPVYAEAGTRFRVGADDSGDVSVGSVSSSGHWDPQSASIVWGDWATVETTGLHDLTAGFASIGGPYDFQVEGADFFFCTAQSLPAPYFYFNPSSQLVTHDINTLAAVFSEVKEPHYTYAVVQRTAVGAIAYNANGGVATIGAAIRNERAANLCRLHENSWTAEFDWTAYYDGIFVTNGTASITVDLLLSGKEAKSNDDCCSCGEGTSAKNGCVSFSQRFGRTPLVEGLPVGRLLIEEERLTDALFTPAVLRYDHPMERRLDASASCVTEPSGRKIHYDPATGKPRFDRVSDDSRLVRVNGEWHEVFGDRSRVVWSSSGGAPSALVTPSGVRVPVAALGIAVERDNAGAISRVTSAADGTLAVVTDSPTSYRVVWSDSSGSPVKTFAFSKEGTDTLKLIDNIYPVRWRWIEANNDFTLVRGEGAETVEESRAVSYDAAENVLRVTKTVSRGGITAAAETEILDPVNGNRAVSRTRGGVTEFAATRVASGGSAGRVASRTSRLGAATSFTYDAQGRVLSETTTWDGHTRTVTRTYSGDPLDRRPVSTMTVLDGVEVSVETFAETTDPANGIRTVVSTDNGLTTVRTYHSASSANLFEAGRLRSVVRPGGRMTVYDYDADTLTVTATEGVSGADGGFEFVDGQSTRTLTAYDARGDAVRVEEQGYVAGAWHTLSWETRTYSAAHKHIGSEYSNGLFRDSRWNCSGPIWEIGTDGIATTNTYDTLKRMRTSTRHGSFGAVTETYGRDADGNVTTTVTSAEGLEPLTDTTSYDTAGRRVSETDAQGRTTAYAYSADGRTTTVTLPSGATRVTTFDALGRVASVTGTAQPAEFRTYGVTEDGLEWTQTNYLSPNGARWSRVYTDGAGRTVIEERSGANGATLATTNSYDTVGRLVSSVSTGKPTVSYAYDVWGDPVSVTLTADGVSRTTETETRFVLDGGEVWRETVRTEHCSDPSIAPIVTTERERVSGLTAAVAAEARATDARGNTASRVTTLDGALRTVTTAFPHATNPQVTVELDGLAVTNTTVSGVTATADYDAFRRRVSETDGRGNATVTDFDAFGRVARVTDASGAATAYAYDALGQVVAVTNALGNVTEYAYDLRGNKTFEGGATYPVRYAYDMDDRMTGMTIYRDGSAEGDMTEWTYDAATGALLRKTYADGSHVDYTYTGDGRLSTRTGARGVVTTYQYDGWGRLTNISYSDGTPTVATAYDAMGRAVSVADAAGIRTFTYAADGSLDRETTVGLCNKTLVRLRDAFGRGTGFKLDGSQKNIIEYDAATGRIRRMKAGGAWFTWEYLAGTDLKSKLTYGGSGNTTWTYEADRDLLTQVRNFVNGGVVSQYDYVNDAAGRRTQIAKSGSLMSAQTVEGYGYNIRDELVSGQGNTYAYDDIGNRTTAEGKTYTANALNQYDAIGGFAPVYDADGNQTLVKTTTGVWTVAYNGENRPVSWTCGTTNIVMTFDYMGRRVEYLETIAGVTNRHERFVYDGYLCVQRLNAVNGKCNAQFIWDPTEPVATRPLFMQDNAANDNGTCGITGRVNGGNMFFTFDGNKNVSEVVHFSQAAGIAAHYEYAPFGAVTSTTTTSTLTFRIVSSNPFRFSSEYHDDTLGLVYYNYRHYNPVDGRWTSRDPAEDELNIYLACGNSFTGTFDILGLWSSWGLWDDHQDMVENVLNRLLDSIPCLQDRDIKTYLLGKIIDGNNKMDSDENYNQSTAEQLPLHYNRAMDQDASDAIQSYQKGLDTRRGDVNGYLNKGSPSETDCDKILDILGEVTHMLQDYFGHGVSQDYKISFPAVDYTIYYVPYGYSPCYGPVISGSIGKSQGSPYRPKMKPSSYAGAMGYSEHGPIWWPEPGNRAPDSHRRHSLSEAYTAYEMKKYLSKWCEICCKKMETIKQEAERSRRDKREAAAFQIGPMLIR